MRLKYMIAVLVSMSVCPITFADETYTLHENLHVGQKIPFLVTVHYKVKSTAITNGVPVVTNTETGQSWKLTLQTLEVKDGSSMRAQVSVDPDSFDTTRDNGQDEKKTPCPYAGKQIIISRHPDETMGDDFHGEASSYDVNMLDGLIVPDADFYPDKPVAVGDTWDNSAKLGRHSSLGPKDQLTSVCRLDWVKVVNGKKMAQISNSQASIYHEDGNVEEDLQNSTTLMVDLGAGMIVGCDQKGTSKYITPPTEATQVVGGTEVQFHSELAADAATEATTQPGSNAN